MIGYKGFNADFTCRGFQYEVGKTYKTDDDIKLCCAGFHFCKNIADCFDYYNDIDSRFARVEAIGTVIDGDNKCVTNELKIIEEIPHDEAVRMSNTGHYNTGHWNTGHYNTGHYNTGHWNTGDWNTGDWNTGDRNTGDRNTGHYNTGDWNTGDWNTGDWNTGDWNTGDWNASSFNVGCFMTSEQRIPFFNKPSDWTREKWLYSKARYILIEMPQAIDVVEWISESDMSDAEKKKNPTYKTTGGYLKVSRSNCDKQTWWDNLPVESKAEVMSLPNFDAEIFKQCTGIEVTDK